MIGLAFRLKIYRWSLYYLKYCYYIFTVFFFLSFLFILYRCLIVIQFRRKVTPSARANQPMNSGLTTGLFAARVWAWKRVMNRLIPFHSQPGIPRLHFPPSRIPRLRPPPPLCVPLPLTTRRIDAIQSLKIGCRKQPCTLLAVFENVRAKPLIPSLKLTRKPIFFYLYFLIRFSMLPRDSI